MAKVKTSKNSAEMWQRFKTNKNSCFVFSINAYLAGSRVHNECLAHHLRELQCLFFHYYPYLIIFLSSCLGCYSPVCHILTLFFSCSLTRFRLLRFPDRKGAVEMSVITMMATSSSSGSIVVWVQSEEAQLALFLNSHENVSQHYINCWFDLSS